MSVDLAEIDALLFDIGGVVIDIDVLRQFEVVFESFTVGLRKPDREAFEFVADSIEVPLGRILFFDDSLENVNGAIGCGMRAVLVRSTEDIRSALRPASAR